MTREALESKALVSIGVPTFNRPELLASALAQLSQQTYPHLEIIVSDNCSPGEKTRLVVEKQAAIDPRIVYHRQHNPLTAIDNFRFVLQQARGKYFMWATDDDQRRPAFVETLVRILEEDEGSVLAYSDATLMSQGETLQTLDSRIHAIMPSPLARVRNVLLHQNLNNEICGLFRRDILADYSFPKFYGSDHAILVHAAMHGTIRKGPPGLFSLGLGGVGTTAEGVVRALGLPANFWNLHFGTLAQAVGLYRWAASVFPLSGTQKFSLAAALVHRVLLVKVYRDELILNLWRLGKDAGRSCWQFARSLPRRILGRIGMVADFFRVAQSVRRNMRHPLAAQLERDRILLVSLEGMNHFIPVLWGVIGWGLRGYGYDIQAVSFSTSVRNNWLFRLFRIPFLAFDRFPNDVVRPEDLQELKRHFVECTTLSEVLAFVWQGLPLGKYSVSTYCRENKSGEADLKTPKVIGDLAAIAQKTYSNYLKAKQLLTSRNIGKAFFTELNTDSYGGFYLAAIELNIDIVRWASSNRDNAYLLQHLGRDFHSWHHSSLTPITWERVRQESFERDEELKDFFSRRYGGEWAVFARNYRGTQEASSLEIRRWLGLEEDQKVAIVFSHILYDTLYFYGDDLFASYVDWLIETVRCACANPQLTWLIKVHPSNIWRGEKKLGEHEEELLIGKYVGALPSHVRIIPPNTPFSPISWMKFADFCITVRGTAGLEMAAMGKTVITAGRGRYDRSGFTADPDTADEYRAMLSRLPVVDPPTSEQTNLARQYMHAVFIRKAFKIDALQTALATGKKDLTQYNDLLLLPADHLRGVNPTEWREVKELATWLEQRDKLDYLAG